MKRVLFLILLIFLLPKIAQGYVIDFDKDGLSDKEEISVYFTDPADPDTDDDGYLDGDEIKFHYSPHFSGKTLSQADLDGDGLSDWLEILFHTNLNSPDSDNDGYSDFIEVSSGFDPLNAESVKLSKKIIINTGAQTLTVFLSGIPLNTFPVSTGKSGYETPIGVYQVENKHLRAWSNTYGLWMPYWLGFIGTTYGMHELPEWPGGFKEGEAHLGQPVSHGCVRLGVGPAAWLYNWADIGTEVVVQK